jgi:hypothetical protein
MERAPKEIETFGLLELTQARLNDFEADGRSFGFAVRSSWMNIQPKLPTLLLIRGSSGNRVLSMQYGPKERNENGGWPAAIRYTMHPTDQISTAFVYSPLEFVSSISGAM